MGHWTYIYDLAGRPLSKTITQSGSMFKHMNYAFYEGTSLLQTVSDINNDAYTEINEYSPQGKIEFLTNSNGTMTNYIYDSATGRISIINGYNLADETIIDKAYTYSKAGNVTQVANNRIGIDYNYYYDHLHRLISEQTDGENATMGTSVEIIEFTYDDENTPVHAPSSTTHNGVESSYSYTSTGNRMNKTSGLDTASYESNYDNMITSIIVDGVETNLYYDADNKRVKKSQSHATTLYFGEDFEIINGVSTAYVFAGNLRIAKVTNTTREFFHKDHLNSTEAISDAGGNIVDLGEYLPYGQDRETNDLLQHSSYKFTDQEQDDGTGLYNYDARLYDPEIGQFIMADTIIPAPFNPQSLNRYAYCLNNPLRYVDPTGHWFDGVESDPSDYDLDYGGIEPEAHVDYLDGDDYGEGDPDVGGSIHVEGSGWTKPSSESIEKALYEKDYTTEELQRVVQKHSQNRPSWPNMNSVSPKTVEKAKLYGVRAYKTTAKGIVLTGTFYTVITVGTIVGPEIALLALTNPRAATEFAISLNPSTPYENSIPGASGAAVSWTAGKVHEKWGAQIGKTIKNFLEW